MSRPSVVTVRRALSVAIATIAILASLGAKTNPVHAAPDWLDYLNGIRALANLPPVTESPALSDGALKHSQYAVANGVIGHTEDPTLPMATPEGAKAAQNGNVFGGGDATLTFKQAMDGWLTGPYHGMGMLDPRLTQVGFGLFADPNAQGVPSAATLDIISGRDFTVAPAYPVLFPANGTTSPYHINGRETPNSLFPCPGYADPAGTPIYLQLAAAPNVTAFAVTVDSTAGNLDTCMYTGATVTVDDPAWLAVAQQILGVRNAVVIIPKAPLAAGTYRVSVTNDGQPITWSFTVAP